MALWDNFISNISTAKDTLGASLKTLTGGGAYLSEDEKQKEQALRNAVKDALARLDNQGQKVGFGYDISKKVVKGVGDKLLQTAVTLQKEVLSPYIFRPISTVALLADSTSPLYKPGEYEQGFQFTDIKKAYERSAKVSTMQALTKSDLIPFTGALSNVILKTATGGKIDTEKVNLWDDNSIKVNYVDNAVGRWFTGIGDFVVGTKAITVAAKAAKVGVVKGVGKPLGLSTSGKTIDELATDMENGINYATSNGTLGTPSISGNHMVVLANTQDWETITGIVSKYSTNEKLIPIIRDATDPMAVKDMILADKGNLAAMERLAGTAPDKLFDMSDTAAQLQSKVLKAGKSYLPEGPAVPRLKAAYDAAIKSNPQFVKIKEAFFDENYNIKLGGRAYMPVEPTIGTSAAIKAGNFVREVKAATRVHNEKQLATVMETTLGTTGRIATKLVKWTSYQGEYKPLGFVTFSGMRPLDGRIEFNAFLNDLKIFKDGNAMIETAPGVKELVSDVRARLETEYMLSIGKNEVQTLEKIDAEIGKMLAYKVGMYDQKEIASHIKEFRKNIREGLNSVQQNGYGIAHDGTQILVNPQTLRQMAESYRFTPWNDIERQFDNLVESSKTAAGAKAAGNLGKELFRDLNRFWSFDVLVRPMYIVKQSIGEPIVSVTLAQGLANTWEDVTSISGNVLKNIGNWSLEKGTARLNKAERKAVVAAVKDKQQALAKAEEIKNIAQASLEDILSGSVSPAAKKVHLKAARKDLAAASALLDEVELDLRAAVVPYGVREAIPSISTLERRIAFLESRSTSRATAAKIKAAKNAIAHYRTVINKLATNKKVIKDADAAVASAYNEIDAAVKALGRKLEEQANVWGKTQKFKERYYAKENQYRLINGEYVAIDSFVAGPSAFSAAIRAETSNARTVDLNNLGDLSVGMRKSLVQRKVPVDRVKVSDPLYFSELEYIANRVMRQDPLMDLILGEKSAKELAKWSKTDAGITYLKAFDVEPADYVSYIADKIAMVHRTFPTAESRAAVLNHEVSAQELQKLLGSKVDELYDIIPSNYNYGAANLGAGGYKWLSDAANNAAATMFRKMASFENPIRNAYFDRIAIDQVARRAEILMQQGVEMTTARYNALRQAAGREALQEMEKTVYTIRRQNRLLHNARWAVAFPTATVNAFYRYGRLAAKNPERAAGFLFNYSRMFNNFGVDENGNPTNNMSKVTHIIVPGTKDVGWGNFGEGIALSSRALGFLLNQPSPSFVTSLSVGKIMQTFPGTQVPLKEALNIGGTDWYSLIFPYGAPTDLRKQFTPRWLSALDNALSGDQGKADYLASWNSVYNYHHMLYEMGVETKPPTDAQILKEVKALWWNKFQSSFMSLAGVPFKVETTPMSLPTNLYYKLVEKYQKQGKDYQKARDLAGDEMIGLLGTKFMVDRIEFTGSSKNLNIPATYEAFARVFEDNDALVGKLAAIDSNDIRVVGLLTSDIIRNPSDKQENIIALLSDPNLKLPGTSKNINEFKLTPQETERERVKQRTWDQYNLVKDALEAKITDGKTLRSHPELQAALEQTVEGYFRNQSQAWYDEYKMAQTGDTAYKYARALTTIVNDPAFMAKHGNSDYWHDAGLFIKARSIFATFYNSLPDYDKRKALVLDNYNTWIESTASQWNPNLKYILKTYFGNDQLKVVN